MTLKFASWNVEGRLSQYATKGRGTPDKIIDEIERVDADVIVLPEAYDKHKGVSQHIDARIWSLGYKHVHDVEYRDGGPFRYDGAVEAPYLRMMSKIAFQTIQTIRLGDIRNAIDATVIDPDSGKLIRMIGVHFDDRNEGLRLRQVDDVVSLTNDSAIPIALLGDMNAMYGESKIARLLSHGATRTLAHAIPHEKLSDVMVRATDMATGTTIKRLMASGMLRDADDKHRFTTTARMRGMEWMPSARLLDIDHILVSPELETSDFRIGKYDAGSDHRPISVQVTMRHDLQK
jgi:endonuclease/exonuclease/phosphatase family metal-dependent hydrolase